MDTYRVLTLDRLFQVPAPPMLIDGILPKNGITGITADPGTGKTWFTLEMARAVAMGDLFIDRFQARRGTAVFVGQDASVFDYAAQMRKLFKPLYDEFEEFAQREPWFVNPLLDGVRSIIQPGIALEDSESVKRLIHTVQTLEHSDIVTEDWVDFDPQTGERIEHRSERTNRGADLIVLDTLSAMENVPENDNTEMARVFRNLRAIADQTGAGIVVVHHNSHSTQWEDERWRGASSQWGALDSWFQLKAMKGDRVRVKCKKFRGIKPETFYYSATIDHTSAELSFVEPPPDPLPVKAEIQSAVLAYLSSTEATEPVPRATLGAQIRPRFHVVAESTYWKYVDTATKALAAEGSIKKVKDGWLAVSESDGPPVESGQL